MMASQDLLQSGQTTVGLCMLIPRFSRMKGVCRRGAAASGRSILKDSS